jgi:hypothetical protein
MTTVKIKSGDWEVEVSTSRSYAYPSDVTDFIKTSIDSAVKNYIEPKTTIKQSDLDIRDNQIELLKEDLESVHMYLDTQGVPRKDEMGEVYSIVGRIKQTEKRFFRTLSEIESSYLKMESKKVDPDTVDKLLEAQRGNCYVAVLTKTRDEEIAKAAGAAPEPGGNWREYYVKDIESETVLVESINDAE